MLEQAGRNTAKPKLEKRYGEELRTARPRKTPAARETEHCGWQLEQRGVWGQGREVCYSDRRKQTVLM